LRPNAACGERCALALGAELQSGSKELDGIGRQATPTPSYCATTSCVPIDHCTAECVGTNAAKAATRFEALEPMEAASRMRAICAQAGMG
jgi:hypothetical protein